MSSRYLPNITRGRMEWAREHDWFVSSHRLAGFTIDRYRIVVRTIDQATGIRRFQSFDHFEDLRAWAGY